MVQWGIAIEFEPWRPIFEKCSHLREKGGVLTLKTPCLVCAYSYNSCSSFADLVIKSIQRFKEN